MEDYTFRGQRDNEEVLIVIKQNVWVFAKTGLFILILINLLVAVFAVYGASVSTSIALFIFLILSIVAFLYRWFIWNNGVYLLTNQRIIKINQQSLFHRVITEAELDRIQDISTEIKGPIQTMLNFGTIHIQTASSKTEIDLACVTDPYELQQQIMKALNFNKEDLPGKIEFQDNFDNSSSKGMIR
jgi:membrane protein YdbS with pleckstrin-like domain